MSEPVRLPGGQYLDRVTIKRQLLSDERDPFTRAPLKISELKVDEQLKAEIEKWKKQRLEELKKGDKKLKYGKIADAKKNETE
jgi:ubiquitin conjugation factor E4 B